MERGPNEKSLQLYWLSSVRRGARLSLVDGREAEVLSAGILNHDSGPDFSFARIKLDGHVWAGNIEMHLRASDWYRHGHDKDSAYGSVVLHVVSDNDCRVENAEGQQIPQTVMTVPAHFALSVKILGADAAPYIRCGKAGGFLDSLTTLQRRDWMETLLAERFRQKADRVLDLHSRLKGDWRQTALATLARALGFGVNAEPMEMMAAAIPLNTLERHSESLFQLEALLFGQAGMLPGGDNIFDEYYQSLVQEFNFLGHKYGIRPLYSSSWKFARTRPANSPYRRIAQLAAYCKGGFSFLSDILDSASEPEALCDIFVREPSEYWRVHNSFNSGNTVPARSMTAASRRTLCINAVVPLLSAYGRREGRPQLSAKAEDTLIALKAETWSLAGEWRRLGIPVESAADTQALLHLHKTYCSMGKCLECRWGIQLLRFWNREPLLAMEHFNETTCG